MSEYWGVDMKNIKYIISATVASVALMLSVALPKVVGATQTTPIDIENKVTICHRTNSVKNPYVEIPVDTSAVDGQGNNDHSLHIGPVVTPETDVQALKDNKIKWGDIIPPVTGVTSGLNWDSGQAVLENGCLGGQNIVGVVPAAVTFTAPTCYTLGSYTIPTTGNVQVQYLINGKVVVAGTYTAQNGTTVTVTAEATRGFFIGDETTDTWTNAFTAPTNCGEVQGATTTTPPQVTAKPVGGVSAGGGGGSSTSTAAMVGLVGSIVTLGLGLLIRKRTI